MKLNEKPKYQETQNTGLQDPGPWHLCHSCTLIAFCLRGSSSRRKWRSHHWSTTPPSRLALEDLTVALECIRKPFSLFFLSPCQRKWKLRLWFPPLKISRLSKWKKCVFRSQKKIKDQISVFLRQLKKKNTLQKSWDKISIVCLVPVQTTNFVSPAPRTGLCSPLVCYFLFYFDSLLFRVYHVQFCFPSLFCLD